MDSPLNCQFYRRFGIEIEVNTSDGVVKRPNSEHREIPLGADIVARIVCQTTQESVTLSGWDHVHNNTDWVIKPDNSCGIEVNSPVLKGWMGLEKIMRVAEALNKAGIHADDRCSLHVHVNIADLTKTELASVIAHYIKCEHVFFDSVPDHRKHNRYCQLIGMTDLFSHDFPMREDDLIMRVSATKYTSLNVYHFIRGGGFTPENPRKQTVEFRIMEGDACIDPWLLKNWVRLLLHFVEVTRRRPLPPRYEKGNAWSSLLWLDPKDVFALLKFDGNTELSSGLKQVRDWFLERLHVQWKSPDDKLPVIWSHNARRIAHEQENALYESLVMPSQEPLVERLYGKKYVL